MSGYAPGRYGIHGLAVVELSGPHAPASFFLPGLPAVSGPPDVVWGADVAGLRPVVVDPRDPGPARSHAGTDVDGRWRLSGPGHDGRLPVQDVLLRAGASLVHGTALAVEGRGVLVLGPPGSGKTVLALAPLGEAGWRLVADDLVVATTAGDLLPTEAPLAIYPEHAALLPPAAGLRPGAKRAWRAVRDAPVVGAAAQAAKRWAGRQGGSLGSWARRFEARYVSVAPADLFPPERRAPVAELTFVLVLDPAGEPWALAATTPETAGAAAIAEAYADGEMHAQLAGYGRAGVLDVAAHWEAATRVLGGVAAAAARHATLGVPRRADPAELLRRGRDAISELLG